MLLACIKAVVVGIAIISSLLQHSIGNIVFASAVALHDGFYQILWHILIVCQQLLSVLRQTVAAITKRRIIVECANTWIQSHTINDRLSVQAFHLGISIKLVEIANAQSQIGVGKELHRLSLFHAHKQHIDILLLGTLLQQLCKHLRILFQSVYVGNSLYSLVFGKVVGMVYQLWITNDDTAWI